MEHMTKSASTLLQREYLQQCKINHKALEPASSCVTFVSYCKFFFFFVDHLLHPLTSLDIKMTHLSGRLKILRDGRFLAFVEHFAYRVWLCPNMWDKPSSDIGLQARCFEYIGYFFISGSPDTYTCH